MTKTRTYGFRIIKGMFGDSPDVTVRVMAREGNASYPINPRSDGEHEIWDAPKAQHGMMLNGLCIKLWWSEDYGWSDPHIWFDTGYNIDCRAVNAMAKTMARINKAITKTQAREAGDVVMAVAKAIGATFTVTETGLPRSSNYCDSEWRFVGLEETRDQIRRVITEKDGRKQEVA